MTSVTPTIAASNTGLVEPERVREKTKTIREKYFITAVRCKFISASEHVRLPLTLHLWLSIL